MKLTTLITTLLPLLTATVTAKDSKPAIGDCTAAKEGVKACTQSTFLPTWIATRKEKVKICQDGKWEDFEVCPLQEWCGTVGGEAHCWGNLGRKMARSVNGTEPELEME